MSVPTSSRSPKLPRIQTTILITLLAVTLGLAASAQAQTDTTIYNFGTSGPRAPQSGVVFDAAGNLYGVTPYGGTSNHGEVYKLTPVAGGWEESVIYNFTGGTDGGAPYATPIVDSAGNLYGTTEYGGETTTCSGLGCGTVYKLTPGTSGEWTESVIHAFTGRKDGGYPVSGNLILDAAGNLYGSNGFGANITTQACQNTSGCGVIFELSPLANGKWKFNLVHTFTGSWDGVGPAGLAFSPTGVLFGSAAGAWGGWESPSEPGLIFAMIPLPGGGWKETVVYAFGGSTDGGLPSTPVFDKAGNIYGSGADGGIINNCWGGYGPIGCGVVFKISPLGGGKWQESVLYAFTGGTDGSQPDAGLVFDKGNLYGTTWSGGVPNSSGVGGGVLFSLSPQPGGGWTETVAHIFTGDDGWIPLSRPVTDAAGNLYGTTLSGGTNTFGVVFELTP